VIAQDECSKLLERRLACRAISKRPEFLRDDDFFALLKVFVDPIQCFGRHTHPHVPGQAKEQTPIKRFPSDNSGDTDEVGDLPVLEISLNRRHRD
jgi:hypothetical protein